MRLQISIFSVALLSGCSCAITSIPYSPVGRHPSIETMDTIANNSGFRNYHDAPDRRSYRNNALGMHFTQPSGDLEFVNSHCPIFPFWMNPGRAFDKRWEKMSAMLKNLDTAGFPYHANHQAEDGTAAIPFNH